MSEDKKKIKSKGRKRMISKSPETSPTSRHPQKVPATTNEMSELADLKDSIHKMLQSHTESVKQMFTKHTTQVDKAISELKNDIKTELLQQNEQLRQELKADLNALNTKVNEATGTLAKQIKSVDLAVTSCTNRLNATERDFDRIKLMNEVKIIGIPPASNENLDEVFMKLATVIGFNTSTAINIPTTKRLLIRDKVSGERTPSKILVAKFAAPHIKDTFYSLYLNKIFKKEEINTANIGFTVSNRIIIGENLTKYNANLFKVAQKLKTENKLAQVYTMDGAIYVKTRKGDKAQIIRDLGDLNFIANNSLPQQPTDHQPHQPLQLPSTSQINTTNHATENGNRST